MEENQIVPVAEKEIMLGAIPLDPQDVIQRASEIATALAKIVNERKLYKVISDRKYVHVEGWSTLGAMLGVLPLEKSVTQIEKGYEAYVQLIRSKDGQVVGGASAICTRDERNWHNRDEYAVRSMAITRATGKAYRLGFSWIMQLAGYEVTPAEEIPSDPIDVKAKPAEKIIEELGYEPKYVPVEAPQEKEKEPVSVERPLTPTTLRSKLAAKAAKHKGDASPEQIGLMVGMMETVFAPDKEADKIRRSCLRFLWGTDSSKKMTGAQVKAMLDWLKPEKDSGGAYFIDPMAATELTSVWTAAQKEAGQKELI